MFNRKLKWQVKHLNERCNEIQYAAEEARKEARSVKLENTRIVDTLYKIVTDEPSERDIKWAKEVLSK